MLKSLNCLCINRTLSRDAANVAGVLAMCISAESLVPVAVMLLLSSYASPSQQVAAWTSGKEEKRGIKEI